MTHEEILAKIRASAAQRILFLPHATRQMMRPDRMILTTDVRMVIENGEIIENYPNDARGHSCLVLGFGEHRRFIHVVYIGGLTPISSISFCFYKEYCLKNGQKGS